MPSQHQARNILAAACLLFASSCSDSEAPAPAHSPAIIPAFVPHEGEPVSVGRAACARCHAEEDELWENSHHDLAMQRIQPGVVLGDFNDATFTHFGVTSRFFKEAENYFVETDGPDGHMARFKIMYVFGVTPLQQYLVEFSGSRLQVLGICWDSRPKEAGGQRWFHLYPNEAIPHDDELHWTGPNQNWNFMCAECHSTNVRNVFDVDSDSYETTWDEIDVSCEACHGPGSRHVAWGEWTEALPWKQRNQAIAKSERKELQVLIERLPDSAWVMNHETGQARREGPLPSPEQMETCARCHSRRTLIWHDYRFGRPLLDTHRLALLDEDLYHPDGQIIEEVYVYGSFIQSKMYHQGVVCTDCHDAHSLELRFKGNAVCSRCHHTDKYDQVEHHHHKPGTEAATCVACHMPMKRYMVVDPRYDHSMRVPRPDLSVELGTPDACSGCHSDKSLQWSIDAARKWYGTKNLKPHFGKALHAGRRRLPASKRLLARLVADTEQPAIARATALGLLRDLPSAELPKMVSDASRESDPLLRLGAAMILDIFPHELRVTLGMPLVEDDVRAVRLEAVRHMAEVPAKLLTIKEGRAVAQVTREYLAAQDVNADRPWAHVNKGNIYLARKEYKEAETAFRVALRIDPGFEPAWANLADLKRALGRDGEAEAILRKGLSRLPKAASLHHALGLTLVRLERPGDALVALEKACALRPQDQRFAFVYGVALNSAGRNEEAAIVLERASKLPAPGPDLLFTLVKLYQDLGRPRDALRHARALSKTHGENPQLRDLISSLEAAIKR